MPARRLPSVVVAAVALAAASRPAAAQRAASAATAAATAVTATPIAARPTARPLATYYVSGTRGDVGLPTRVVVADSGGELVAHVQIIGERAPRAMAVTVIEHDLVLQADTPRGLLTFVLAQQNENPSAHLRGRWALGIDRGPVRGRQLGS